MAVVLMRVESRPQHQRPQRVFLGKYGNVERLEHAVRYVDPGNPSIAVHEADGWTPVNADEARRILEREQRVAKRRYT